VICTFFERVAERARVGKVGAWIPDEEEHERRRKCEEGRG
jgi:hypothetical protein